MGGMGFFVVLLGLLERIADATVLYFSCVERSAQRLGSGKVIS